MAEVLRRGNNDLVSRYAAENPNTPPKALIDWMRATGKIGKEDPKRHIIEYDSKEEVDEDLEKLKKLISSSKFNLKKYSQFWYTVEVAKNTKDPKILTDILSKGKDDWVSCFAAENPNTPPEILAEVLRRGKDDWVSQHAAKNTNCPPKALAEVLSKGKDDDWVSLNASRNPNCPPKALIDWMRAIGKIGKEDPKRHIIEYDSKDNKEEVDEDFEKLKKLISKNNGWYKKAMAIPPDLSPEEQEWIVKRYLYEHDVYTFRIVKSVVKKLNDYFDFGMSVPLSAIPKKRPLYDRLGLGPISPLVDKVRPEQEDPTIKIGPRSRYEASDKIHKGEWFQKPVSKKFLIYVIAHEAGHSWTRSHGTPMKVTEEALMPVVSKLWEQSMEELNLKEEDGIYVAK